MRVFDSPVPPNPTVAEAAATRGVHPVDLMIQLALEMPPSDELTPAALAALQKAAIDKWWPLMKAAGIKHQ